MTWKCTICTFENTKNFGLTCEVCGSIRETCYSSSAREDIANAVDPIVINLEEPLPAAKRQKLDHNNAEEAHKMTRKDGSTHVQQFDDTKGTISRRRRASDTYGGIDVDCGAGFFLTRSPHEDTVNYFIYNTHYLYIEFIS